MKQYKMGLFVPPLENVAYEPAFMHSKLYLVVSFLLCAYYLLGTHLIIIF